MFLLSWRQVAIVASYKQADSRWCWHGITTVNSGVTKRRRPQSVLDAKYKQQSDHDGSISGDKGNVVGVLLTVYPVIEPVVVLFFVRSYREAILSYLGLLKDEPIRSNSIAKF